jgi:hypothetical protein
MEEREWRELVAYVNDEIGAIIHAQQIHADVRRAIDERTQNPSRKILSTPM